jgi:3-methylfumaryl-CoA hydratase
MRWFTGYKMTRHSSLGDLGDLLSYVGRSESKHDRSATEQLDNLAATLDEQRRFLHGTPLPPLWHWIFFKPEAPQAELRADGHPAMTSLLPPIPLPRRMWAGSRLRMVRPLRAGHALSRLTTIENVAEKLGTEGVLLFITLRHLIADEEGEALIEEQDLVYKAAPVATLKPARRDESSRVAPEPCDWHEQIEPTTTLLFRYSALTFNAHRIHYDRPYAQSVECYPGLVVHGPLIATLLMRGAARAWPHLAVSFIEYRGKRPMFDTAPIFLKGRRTSANGATLWAHDELGRTCATLVVEFLTADGFGSTRAAS